MVRVDELSSQTEVVPENWTGVQGVSEAMSRANGMATKRRPLGVGWADACEGLPRRARRVGSRVNMRMGLKTASSGSKGGVG